MKYGKQKKQGVAYPEVLFALSIVLIVASILVPAVFSSRQQQRLQRAYADINLLVDAAYRYNLEYRLWPVVEPPGRNDARFGKQQPNRSVMYSLRSIDGTGNEEHRANPSRIDFIELASAGPVMLRFNEDGDVIDPWGNPYEMVFDSNYDSICSLVNSTYGPVIGEGVLVWSTGPDGESDTKDDVLSWLE